MRRILAPAIPQAGASFVLPAAESHHLLQVIRLARGERVRVVDGRGGAAVATLDGVEGDFARLLVEALEVRPPLPARVVVLGTPKPALLEEALTLGTEAGATAFLLVSARRSPPGGLREERALRVLQAAVTQCGRADVPRIRSVASLASVLHDDALSECATRWLCDAGGADATPVDGALALAIGPEGGWDDVERALLAAAGFVAVTLAPFTLRTPTAVAIGLGRTW